jgi:transposase InsO family protein
MKDICSLLNIKQTRTTAYHPATDGNVESFNRTMGEMLATGLSRDINRWDEYLPFVIYIYNTSVHTSTNETPHYLLYGQDPIEPDDISSDTARKRCIDEGSDEFFSIW